MTERPPLLISHLAKGVRRAPVWSWQRGPAPLGPMRLVPAPRSLTPLAEATFWESRLDPTTVTQPRGSESACRGEAGELVHLDPEAPPWAGGIGGAVDQPRKMGWRLKQSTRSVSRRTEQGKSSWGGLHPAAQSRGISSSLAPGATRRSLLLVSTPPSGSLKEPSPRRTWTGTSLASRFVQLETG